MDRAEAIRQLMAQHGALKAEKAQRLTYWQKRAEYTIPHKATMDSPLTPSSNAYREKYDCTGMLAATQFAANLYTHMSPPNRHWFILAPAVGSALERDRAYGRSLAERTERLHQAFATTNWETEIHNAYEDLAMGTCCVGVKRSEENPFCLSTRPLEEYVFDTDEQQRPNTIFLERRLSAAQAAKKWGLQKIDPELADQLRRLDPAAYTATKDYVNICRPNERWEPSGIVSRGYPYESLWVEEGTNRLLQMGGTRRLRYVVSRFWRPTGMRWGLGPTDMAYGPIRCLDKASEIVLRYAAKAMDPPTIAPDDGSFHPLDRSPGSLILARMGATDRVKPEYLELKTDHRIAQFVFEYYGMQIAQAYMAEVFRMLADKKQRTAKEVVTVLEKSFDIAIPVFGRLRAELFAPLIRLCLELLTEWELGIRGWRYGGQALPEYEYQLELISPLALAIKYAELQSMSDLWVMNSRLAEVDRTVWDNYTLDEMSRGIGDNMAVPERWKRSVTERDAIRRWRARKAAEQQALEQAKLAAETAEKLGRPAAPNSILAEVA
ncbi:MAG TPA: portal protein [Phycisphaerae bacterium]|nr:portal protein [Phycisphaerae bacterium]